MDYSRCSKRTAPILGALLALIVASIEAAAQVSQLPDEQALKRLSLEELAEIQITSVSRRQERASDAAAAISVITAADIRRTGARSIAEVLRLADGVEVARSGGGSWAISARGFNITFANKMQVFMDGRNVYSPLFAGTFWDAQGTFIEDIERIEVIRGPGAALWGTNAVNGVINIITKPASATPGGLLVAGAGSENNFAGVRYGARIGSRGHFRFYSKYDYTGALAFADGRSANDELQRGFAGFRSEYELSARDQFTVQGDLYRSNGNRASLDDFNGRGGNVTSRWTHQFLNQSELQIQGYYDRSSREIPPSFFEVRNSYDIDAQHHFRSGARHDVVWGLGYRSSADETRKVGTISFDPPERTLHWFNLFGQDEITLITDRLRLVIGSKLERNSYTGVEVQPTVRMAWNQSTASILWAAVSRALRMPTRLDTDLRIAPPVGGLFGNPEQRPEKLLAYELGYRLLGAEGVGVELAGFFNDYDDIRSVELPARVGGPLTNANTLEGHTFGTEMSITVQPQPWWQMRAAYSHLELRLKKQPGSRAINNGQSEANDPEDMFSLRSYIDLPHQLDLNMWLRHVGRLRVPAATATGPVPGYTVFDVRLGWSPVASLELSVVGQNLPGVRHAEFPTDGPQKAVQRGVYGKIAWGF
jgi:iron complex outermembrane recepter protein